MISLQQPTRLLALTSAVVLGCAACGGHATPPVAAPTTPTTVTTRTPRQPASYAAALRALGTDFGAAVDGLYPLDSGPKGSAVAESTTAQLRDAAGVVAKVERRLEALQPPKRVAVQQRTLVQNLERLHAQIEQLATATADGDARTFDRLSQLPQLRAVSNAAAAMKKRGYAVLGA